MTLGSIRYCSLFFCLLSFLASTLEFGMVEEEMDIMEMKCVLFIWALPVRGGSGLAMMAIGQ